MKHLLVLLLFLIASFTVYSQEKFIEVLVHDTMHVEAETLEITIMALDNNGISNTTEIVELLKSQGIAYQSDETVVVNSRPEKNASFFIIPDLDRTQFKFLNAEFKKRALSMAFTSKREHSRILDYEKELISKLLESAAIQADLYASTLNLSLGEVISISEKAECNSVNNELGASAGWHTQIFSKYIKGDTKDESHITLSKTASVRYSITGN